MIFIISEKRLISPGGLLKEDSKRCALVVSIYVHFHFTGKNVLDKRLIKTIKYSEISIVLALKHPLFKEFVIRL